MTTKRYGYANMQLNPYGSARTPCGDRGVRAGWEPHPWGEALTHVPAIAAQVLGLFAGASHTYATPSDAVGGMDYGSVSSGR